MYVIINELEDSVARVASEGARLMGEKGVAILRNAVNVSVLDMLRDRMEHDTQTLLKRGTWGGAGQVSGHLQQVPPVSAPFVHEDVVSNPFIMGTLREVLGEGFFLSLYSANVNTPGSAMQRVHADAGPLWFNAGIKDRKYPLYHPATTLVVNIPLIDTDEENGSTEVYPGSHKEAEVEMWAPEEKLGDYPCVRANTRKGDVVIRDIRTWHRGMPNASPRHRHMLAMIVNVWWLHRSKKNVFHASAKEAFRIPYFDANARFVHEETDHLSIQDGHFQVPYLFEGVHIHHMMDG